MSVPALIRFEPWDVNDQLKRMGLEEALLIRACDQGVAARLSCTADHPPCYAGLVGWGETVYGVRALHKPSNWVAANENNLSLTVNREGTLAILVSTGNEDTGRRDGRPRTSSAKGPRTVKVIESNQMTFPFIDEQRAARAQKEKRETWILLMFLDMKAKEARYELSRPINMDEDGYVDEWSERIILRTTKFYDLDDIKINDDSSPEIDFDLKKRA